MSVPVEHRSAENRFVIVTEGHEAELVYRSDGTHIDFLHTGVPDALGGRGLGKALATAGLEYASRQGLSVRPYCPFVKGYIGKHPEYQDLVG